jgi:hypothetical protein
MKPKSLILDEGTIPLKNDITYTVYGEAKTANQLSQMNFKHLPWLDQKMLLQDITLFGEVSMLYHPEIVASIYADHESSEYWGKNHFECLSIFKRTATKVKVDLTEERLLKKPVITNNPATKVKKSSVVKGLIKLGYDRDTAKLCIAEFLQEKGIGYLNLAPSKIIKYVDKHALSNK